MLVQRTPFKDQSSRTVRKFTMNGAAFDFDGNFVFAVRCVKVWDAMFAKEHGDHDPEESRDFRHAADDDAIV